MGTMVLSNIRTRDDMVEYLKTRYFTKDHRLLDASQKGNILYCAAYHPDHRRFIVVFKLSGGADGWGYKPMTESMGPCFYDCPERLLKMSDDGSEWAVKWREACRRRRREKVARRELAKTCKAGDRLAYFKGYRHNNEEVYEAVTFLRRYSGTFFVGRFDEDPTQYRMRWDRIRPSA